MNPLRKRYIEAGLIVPATVLEPLSADQLDAAGYHAAAAAVRKRR